MATLTVIEGIGKAISNKLAKAGIHSIEQLLKEGATPAGRKAIAEQAGLDPKQVLKWVNKADLMRIKGIGSEFSDLLEAVGVDTVPELARRKAENLHAKMVTLNEAKKLVRRLPTVGMIEGWIMQAKAMDRIIKY
ncbi:MAG TPA: DUF4332 domain-containing protein [Aggregatilineales bacterium]|jgi:predicted flap endonuclease-1-like 5' DNA nuclease|nr:DUF4332 domain-containing protein [Aggregatilineales bacterium]